jgi:hypothetical protein
MPASQMMIFTAVPHSMSLNPPTLPVSVHVSPRLQGDNKLGEYPDWLEWTALRKENGLRITFECQGTTHIVGIATDVLRPDLWHGLFNADTLVRSYRFDDYSNRFVSSYPVRPAIGLLQATYQAAGLALALPTSDGDPRERQPRRRGIFKSLIGGYAIDWSDAMGRRWRQEQRDAQRRVRGASLALAAPRAAGTFIGEDGLFKTGALMTGSSGFTTLQRDVLQRFGVFNDQPRGAPVTRESLDESNVLDFHQALSSLNTYPVLQRMLGLVFDVALPLDFVPQTGPQQSATLRIVSVDGAWSDTPTTVPTTSTACMHSVHDGTRLFGIAPRHVVEPNQPIQVMGLLAMDTARYAIAQMDVDGALHKATLLADTLARAPGEAPPQHPEVFDPTTMLPSLRSGGISLVADARALTLLENFQRAGALNQALEANQAQPRPFCAEDLVRGFRIDVWETFTEQWHSLHRRNASYSIGEAAIEVAVADEEGYIQVGVTQAAPEANGARANDDLYLHEAIARWDGWSLSADTPGKHLTRSPDPSQAVPDAAHPDPENQAITPFKMTTKFDVVPRSLPRLRFGAGYRFRSRAVDLAGNGLQLDEDATNLVTPEFSLPAGDRVAPYLRFEPVGSPVIVLRDASGVTGAGSSVDRLVIRTYNSDLSLDGAAADVSGADRHIVPPRSSVEMCERHGLFDDENGRLNAAAAMWQLIKERDEGKLSEVEVDAIVIDGKKQKLPLEPAARIDQLPYLPDPLARAAALRDLPGVVAGSVGRVEPGTGAAAVVGYERIDDPNPRPGSATIVGFGGQADWQEIKPFRLALGDGEAPPQWDPAARLLTVSLPKGQTRVVPLSSCLDVEDLKLMGVWQWLREYIEFITSQQPQTEFYRSLAVKDRIAHVLQLAREGGHAMLTPPHLITLVHAVQQPLGRPAFTRLIAQFDVMNVSGLQTQPEAAPTAGTELAVISSWRKLGDTDAWLVGALQIHAASTAKIDIRAEWTDPIDDVADEAPGEVAFKAHVDAIRLNDVREPYLSTPGDENRIVGYYNAEHDLICFALAGARLGTISSGVTVGMDAAPRHRVADGKHHLVDYIAVATSRYREYFPQTTDSGPLDFTRESESVEVHVPASIRPVAPEILYVVPVFGWQRETRTNQKRSVRMGGGLRIYLNRPWYSSGVGELLGVALSSSGAVDREDWKPFITQWGQDPIWLSAPLSEFPEVRHFADAVASESALPLDARMPHSSAPRTVDVAGHHVHFDSDRKLWYCDLTIDISTPTYGAFVRLALVRYQPHALLEAKLSRVVLADFAQLTPERAATVTADPYTPGRLRVTVSGPAPRRRPAGVPVGDDRRTTISVTVQRKDSAFESDIAWTSSGDFAVDMDPPLAIAPDLDFILWSGTLRFQAAPTTLKTSRYRVLVEEHEILPADGSSRQSRLIYAETVLLDSALIDAAPIRANRTVLE